LQTIKNSHIRKEAGVNKRLTAAEAEQIRATNGRICRGCRIIFTPDQIPDSFAADERTRDGLTKLCIDCLECRDTITRTRVRDSQATSQARYRDLLREIRFAAVREPLAKALPEHLIPECALPDYPTSATFSDRTDRESAMLTQLYGRLRDAEVTRWEQLAGTSRSAIREHVYKIGPGMLDRIDEHLRAFGLDPLEP
jgi:hypothetical protein